MEQKFLACERISSSESLWVLFLNQPCENRLTIGTVSPGNTVVGQREAHSAGSLISGSEGSRSAGRVCSISGAEDSKSAGGASSINGFDCSRSARGGCAISGWEGSRAAGGGSSISMAAARTRPVEQTITALQPGSALEGPMTTKRATTSIRTLNTH